MAPDATAWYAVILLGLGAVFWVWRSSTRQVDALRDLTRKLERLGARVLAAESRREILDVLELELIPTLGRVSWELFIYERSRRTLESGDHVVHVHAPEEGEAAAIALAFRHRLASRRRTPRSAETTHYLPCGLGDEAHGVLVLSGEALANADGTTLNFLANQIGATLAHHEHLAGRKSDARSEKRQAVSEVLTRVISEIEQRTDFPTLVERLHAMMREEDRTLAISDTPTNTSAVRTTLLLEPDPAVKRNLLAALSERGIRVIPANSLDEAADCLDRIPFDVMFCSARLAEGGFLEITNRLGRKARLVWLVDAQTARWVEGSGLSMLENAQQLDAVVSAGGPES